MQSKQGLCRTDPIDTGPPGPHGLYGHWTCRAAGPGGGGETETKITPAKTNPPAFAWEEPGETGPRGSGGDRKAAAAAVGYVPAASHPAPGITPPGFRLKMWSGRRAVVQFQIITHISDNRVLYLFSSLSIKKKKKKTKVWKRYFAASRRSKAGRSSALFQHRGSHTGERQNGANLPL